MARVLGAGNKATELAIIGIFRKHGIIGWRRRQTIFGKPDFVFWKCRLAVFVDGCFWHGCPRHCRIPQTNREYWERKFARNMDRDCVVTRRLQEAGWRVIRIWGHSLKFPGLVAQRVISELQLVQTPSRMPSQYGNWPSKQNRSRVLCGNRIDAPRLGACRLARRVRQ